MGLHVQRHLANLVQEQRTAVGLLELARKATTAGACKSAVGIAEEFAGQQLTGKSAAVDGNERTVGAVTRPMKRPGKEFLPGSGFAKQQYRQIEWCDTSRARLGRHQDLA